MHRIYLFAISCLLAGLGGALGSIAGNAAGKTGLWVGGIVGGVLGAIAAAAVARGRGWISAAQFGATAAGAVLGFFAAAGVAVNTLSSPLGPIGSTLLIGTGAVIGARLSGAHAAP